MDSRDLFKLLRLNWEGLYRLGSLGNLDTF